VSAQLMRTSSVPLLVMPRGGPHTEEDETPAGVTGSRKA
jgi:hypothetical protein